MAKVNQRNSPKVAGSYITSIALHGIIFLILAFSISNEPAAPIMVNLSKDPGKEIKTIKAGLVNQKAIDLALQRQAMEQKLKQQKIDEQKQAEQDIRDAAEASKALELANLKKAQQEAALKIATEQKAKVAKEIAAKEKIKQDQAKLEKTKLDQAKLEKAKLEKTKADDLKKQNAIVEMDKKLTADKKAAALKSQLDRQVTEHNALLQNEVDKHKAEFQAVVESNRILSAAFSGDIVCKIRVRLLPDGSIISVNIVQSSGNPSYDDLSKSAIYKSAPFPMPNNQELINQLRDVILSFRNGDQSSDA